MRVVADAHFTLRRRVTPAHALTSIEATDALDTLCTDAYRRYDDAPRLVEKVCEDVMEEQVMKLLKVQLLLLLLLLMLMLLILMMMLMLMVFLVVLIFFCKCYIITASSSASSSSSSSALSFPAASL